MSCQAKITKIISLHECTGKSRLADLPAWQAIRQFKMSSMDELGLPEEEQQGDLDAQFTRAADYVAGAVTSGSKTFDDKLKLKLYGYYKQGTAGKCTTNRPGVFDFAGRAKW
jgi:hypothetical protein